MRLFIGPALSAVAINGSSMAQAPAQVHPCTEMAQIAAKTYGMAQNLVAMDPLQRARLLEQLRDGVYQGYKDNVQRNRAELEPVFDFRRVAMNHGLDLYEKVPTATPALIERTTFETCRKGQP